MNPPTFLRRQPAGEYLRETYGFGSHRTLAKLASVGGGPPFRKAGPRIVLYERTELDEWALSRVSAPIRHTAAWVPRQPALVAHSLRKLNDSECNQ